MTEMTLCTLPLTCCEALRNVGFVVFHQPLPRINLDLSGGAELLPFHPLSAVLNTR